MRLPYTGSQGSVVNPLTMAVTKSVELKNSLLSNVPFSPTEIFSSVKMNFVASYQNWDHLNAHLFAELFYLFVFCLHQVLV